jgi:hypothetical protein
MTRPPDPVSLQINLAPTDLPHATHTVPHQLRQWGRQVDEVLFVVDLHRSRGKFADGWDERLPGLRRLIADCCVRHPNVRSVDVEYAYDARARVEAAFFRGRLMPAKDYRGAPFYAYFFALLAASNDYVLHLDSDMMFGGGSPTWVAEALQVLESRPEVLACNPLPGPPTSDGSLRSQKLEQEPVGGVAFRAHELSARLFLLDRRRLSDLRLDRPTWKQAWGARVDGNPPYLPAEGVISRAMVRSGLIRLDFLGRAPGMWGVHPPYRSRAFYDGLPGLISDIECGNVRDGQRGCHDIEDCTIDWSDVRPSRRSRVETHTRLFLDRVRASVQSSKEAS